MIIMTTTPITYLSLPAILKSTTEKFPNAPAFAFAGEKPINYSEANQSIKALMSFLGNCDIKKNDKVAILSTNMPQWALAYFAITSLGAVAVPILPDFSQSEVENVIRHSDTRLIFVADSLRHKIVAIAQDITVVRIEDFSISHGPDHIVYNPDITYDANSVVYEEDPAVIIYTSGTTGRSKGVMLSHRNVCFTAYASSLIQPINENDRFLSVLPLSHTYENTLGLILPVMYGASVWYLHKPPTAPVLLPAMAEVKPTLMLTVPLIIEKVYFNKILPAFNASAFMRFMYGISFFRKMLNKAAGKKLYKTFGGHLKFFGIGGAKLKPEVEKFLYEAHFPYAIGYGLTETSPLLAGSPTTAPVLESTGPAMYGVELKINNPDPKTGIGEIWAKGDNVMMGYYKEPLLTTEIINADGWLKTGDLGMFDKKNNLYIKSRLKNIILGASGENIYPEEIESVINHCKHVDESLVVEKSGKLVAMVYLNMEELELKFNEFKNDFNLKKEEWALKYDEFVDQKLLEIKEYVNNHVSKNSRLQLVMLQPEPFNKTATLKVRRYLYA